MTTEVFHLPAGRDDKGLRFCMLRAPRSDAPKGLVLHAPALAEEMNKSRRMVAEQSRALAANGYAVLQIDLFGCGDSAGDSGDATWEDWVADIVTAAKWLRAEQASRWPAAKGAPLWLWGLRSGCLLASAAADRLDESPHLLFWQPVAAGSAVLRQFLRLRSAKALMGGQDAAGTDSARSELAAGRTVNIAGYRLHPGLASGLEGASLRPARRPQILTILEVAPRESPDVSPSTAKLVASWEQSGWRCGAQAVSGPLFWQTTEIEDAPRLVEATTQAVSAACAAASLPGRLREPRALEAT